MVPISPIAENEGKLKMPSLFVTEIYTSLQGESTYAGIPCTFIRLAGCSLRCRWCDTVYSYSQDKKIEIDDILDQVLSYPQLVEVTGGEPLEQKNSLHLMDRLIEKGFDVLLETSGSECVKNVNNKVTIIMDIKCPGSNMVEKNRYENFNFLKSTDEIKFVISNLDDFKFATEIIKRYELEVRFKILMSAAFGLLKESKLSEWILEQKLSVRLNLQQHKYIWSPKAKGV